MGWDQLFKSPLRQRLSGSRYRGVERHLRQKRRPKAAAKPAAKKKAAVKSSPGAKLDGSDGLGNVNSVAVAKIGDVL